MKFDIIVRLEALKKLSVLDRDKDTIQDAIDTINSLREENESAWSMLEELKASDIKNEPCIVTSCETLARSGS